MDEGYFETLAIPLLSGRGPRATDTAATPRVAIVNDTFARHYWPEVNAIGKRLDFIAQELNREANTLASKAASQEISDCALELKLLIEQMREQVQNIE